MKNISQREKVEALILDGDTWFNGNNYEAIKSFCIDELLVYGIDPNKHMQSSLPVGDGRRLNKKRVLTDYLFDNKFNWTPIEETRALLLIDICTYCTGLKIVKNAILKPSRARGLQAHLNHSEGIDNSTTSETSFNAGSRYTAQLTYMLMLTLRDDLTQIEFDRVKAQIEKSRQDKAKGGKNKAEVEARAIARERARNLKAINPSLRKPDLVEKIIAEMLNDKDKYKLKRNVPSFDTVSRWLVNLDKD